MMTTNNHLQKPIGILGGTFDPIHNGHIQLAKQVLQKLQLQTIRFISCYQPPHRSNPIASPEQRLAMLKIALKDYSNFIIDDREIKRQGKSFMIETLQSLREEFPNTPLCLIVGFDAFAQLSTWHCWEKLHDYAHIIVINRPDSLLELTDAVEKLLEKTETKDFLDLHNDLRGKTYQLQIPPIAISATEIRKQLKQGEKPIANPPQSPFFKGGRQTETLPEAVYQYIVTHGIYT